MLITYTAILYLNNYTPHIHVRTHSEAVLLPTYLCVQARIVQARIAQTQELTSGSHNFHALTLPSDDAENKMSAAGERARPFTLYR